MKLLFVAEHMRCGGAERQLAVLAGGLAARGHQVALAGLKAGAERDASGLQQVACCHSRGGLDLQALARLGALLERERPALLVAGSHYALLFALLARRLGTLDAPLVFVCHGTDLARCTPAARLRFAVYRRWYRGADCVVFASQAQRQLFASCAALPARLHVIHNGVDLARFAPARPAAGQALRAACGFGPGDLVVGLCAALLAPKRQSDLLAAVARLRQQGLPYKAVLVGEGGARAQLEAARQRLGLGGSVLLAGFQADVRPYIGMCDAMALTSERATFPAAILEYMACGKSIVASDVGGLREQLVHGHNGLLYPAGDIDALAAALVLLADPGLRRRLGRAALRTARLRFDHGLMVARYDALFGSLAAPAQ